MADLRVDVDFETFRVKQMCERYGDLNLVEKYPDDKNVLTGVSYQMGRGFHEFYITDDFDEVIQIIENLPLEYTQELIPVVVHGKGKIEMVIERDDNGKCTIVNIND